MSLLVDTPIEIDLDIELDTQLPEHLQGTGKHVNCPELFIVDIIRYNGEHKPMVYLGSVKKNVGELKKGDIAIGSSTQWGHRGLYIFPKDRVVKHPLPTPDQLLQWHYPGLHHPSMEQRLELLQVLKNNGYEHSN